MYLVVFINHTGKVWIHNSVMEVTESESLDFTKDKKKFNFFQAGKSPLIYFSMLGYRLQ